MTSIRVRPPIYVYPLQWTIERYQAGGDGSWLVLCNGNVVSVHTWKWQARLALRRAAANGGQEKAREFAKHEQEFEGE
jgi:hypothetical protein